MAIVSKTESQFTSPTFMSTTLGDYIIRLLDDDTTIPEAWTHWYGLSVKCLGKECPQCEQNRRIKAENPRGFREIEGYRASSRRYAANVLDRSTVKICGQCGFNNPARNGNFQSTCHKCGFSVLELPEVTLNELKVLTKGPDTFTQFDEREADTLDENGDKRGIKNFDLKMVVFNKNAAPLIEAGEDTTPLEEIEGYEDFELVDLNTLIPSVSVEEMRELIRGVPLKDIFASRRLEESIKEEKESPQSLDTDALDAKVEELLV